MFSLKGKIKLIIFLILTGAIISYGQREGFENYFLTAEFAVGAGARALGMGGAFIAVADDATAASWNPAGLAQLHSKEISFSYYPFQHLHGYWPAFFRKIENKSIIQEDSFMPYGEGRDINFLSFAFPIITSSRNYVLLFHYQRIASFSYEHRLYSPVSGIIISPNSLSNYQYTWEGRFKGGFDIISFSFATSFVKNLKFGFSINKWLNKYSGNDSESYKNSDFINNQEKQYFLSEVDSDSYNIKGFNVNLGLLYFIKNLSIGIVYKTPFTAYLNYKEDIHETIVNGQKIEIERNLYKGAAKINWPYTIGLGMAARIKDANLISMDYAITNWGNTQIHNYITDSNPKGNILNYPTLTNPSLSKQSDSIQIRFGFEHVFFVKKLLIPLRAGFFMDRQIFYDAHLKSPYFKGITLGSSLGSEKFIFDIAYLYEFGKYSVNPNNFPFDWTDFHFSKLITSLIIHF